MKKTAKYFGIIGIMVFLAFLSGSQIVSADYSPACPFSPATNRIIVNFPRETLVWGRSTTEVSKNVNIPVGEYRVSLFAYDGYDDRKNVSQPNESYFVELRNGSAVVVQTGTTPDLQDNVKQATYSGYVSTINVTQAATKVLARHANYINFIKGLNSVSAGCVAFDLVSPPVDDLSGSCTVNPSSVNVGGYLNWNATATGGSGSYSYSWTGTDGLYGNSSYVSKSYSNPGTKTGTVTITSGSQSITRSCSGVVNQNINNDLSVSCNASQSTLDIDEDVTWRSYPSGGNGSYSYDWDGTDSLNGSSRNITWSYDDGGTKRATVTVYSGNQTASASCTTRVDEEDNDDLSVYCYASPTTAQVGSRINWYARVSGGDGDYDYDWDGTDNLNSSSRSPYMTYYTPGSKSATVTVRDGDGQRDSDTCYVNVNSVLAFSQTYQAPLEPAVYLSQVPYTGVADNFKSMLFIGLLGLFSAWMAYVVISYKKNQSGEVR